MRILNILEQIQSVYNRRTSDNEFDVDKADRMRQKHDPNFKSPISGAFGRVYKAGDPHLINKVNYFPEKESNDGYMKYMNYLLTSNIASSNPFAPRVYKMDVITDKKEKSKYKVKMETLHRVDEVDKDILEAVAHQLYSYEDMDRASKLVYAKTMQAVLAKCIHLTAEGRITSKNKKLNELCAAIAELAEEEQLDIHGNNIMFRYGKVPQIVIVDPLA